MCGLIKLSLKRIHHRGTRVGMTTWGAFSNEGTSDGTTDSSAAVMRATRPSSFMRSSPKP